MRNSTFLVMFSAALAGVSMMSVACVAEESAGAAGAGGSSGSATGGSSAAGSGGSSTAGSGGSSTAGSGGSSTAGSGGSSTAGSGGSSTAGSGGSSTAGSGGTSAGGAAGAGGGSSGTLDPAKGYIRFAQLAPSALQDAFDVCVRAAGSTNWDTSASGDATQIFKDSGDPGEFYYPTVSTYFEFPAAGNYEFRFVKGDAANCDTPSTKLPGGAGGFYALAVPAGEVYTLVVYDTDSSGQSKALDIVALGSQAPVAGKAAVTWANAMTNVPALDFGSVMGNQFSDLQTKVNKKSSANGTHDPVTARIGSIRSDDVNNKIHSVTATDVELAAGGVYTTFAYGVNEFAVGKLKPGITVCNDRSLATVSGTSTIAAGCVYSAP